MHLELEIYVNLKGKLPQPQMHALVSNLSQIWWFILHKMYFVILHMSINLYWHFET
jgi:hypothetical protein